MLAKCVLCPSCSLIQRRVLEKKVGGDVVVKVDPRHLRSRIQDLQQNVATIQTVQCA